ncbi:MAG TPA: GNAT family N-acetyltransferase [Tepidisphaeraceae bacterium]|jgi:ribosomal protein S18 acetylase RimI-like enzyme
MGVRVLSNFLGRGDGADPAAPTEYRPARADEVQPGLALILGSGQAPAGNEQVLDFLQFASAREINVNDLWVVVPARGRPIWGVLPIVNPGHTALLFAPPRRPADCDVAPLIDAVCEHLARREVYLAQSLLDPADTAGRAMLAAMGFREMAELLYLQSTAPRALAQQELPDSFWWQTYSPQTHPLFAEAILDSYQQSLDCPGLNGLRDIEDVLAGHKASGEFNPRFWFVLMERDMPRGVLLLSRVPRTDAAELVYLGLAPATRGRGLSDLMVRQALWAVREMTLSRLTLAVDSHNAPAIRLYYRHGLQRIGSKVALMRDLRTDVNAECRVPDAE